MLFSPIRKNRSRKSMTQRQLGSSLERLEDRRLLAIDIHVTPAVDGGEPSVVITGQAEVPISAKAMEALSLGTPTDNSLLNNAIHTWMVQNRHPYSIYFPQFSSLRDLRKIDTEVEPLWPHVPGCVMCQYYDRIDVNEVVTFVSVIDPDNPNVEYQEPEVVDTSTQRIGEAHFEQSNDTNEPGTIHVTVSLTKSRSSSHTVSMAETQGFEASVSVEVGPVGAEAAYSYSKEFGEEKTNEVGTDFEVGLEASYPVGPLETIEAFVRYEESSITLRVPYEGGILGGNPVAHYAGGFFGIPPARDFFYDIKDVMAANDLPLKIPVYEEIITIPLYSNAEIIVRYVNDTFGRGRLIEPGDPIRVITERTSRERSEPMHADVETDASVWYTWVAQEDGTARITTNNNDDPNGIAANFDTVIAVYTGASLENLTSVAANDDVDLAKGIKWSEVEFEAKAGTTYHFAIAGYSGEMKADGQEVVTTGITDVDLKFTPTPPANDNFVDSEPLLVGHVEIVDTRNAILEDGEFRHDDEEHGSSVWYSWLAMSDGEAHITTAGSDFDTVMGVYTGERVTDLTPAEGVMVKDDILEGKPQSEATFDAVAGTLYHIAIAGKRKLVNDNDTPNDPSDDVYTFGGVANVELSFTAAGDDFADAVEISTDRIWTADIVSSTREEREPPHAERTTDRTVWGFWIAPEDGVARISTRDSEISDTVLAVYTGSQIDQLTEVVSNDDIDPDNFITWSEVTFAAEAGVKYYVAVAGSRNIDVGLAEVNLLFTPTADLLRGDYFEDAIPLVPDTTAEINTTTATRELGEPAHHGNASHSTVWYSWTPTENGDARISTEGSEFDTILAVYTGLVVSNLVSVPGASNDDVGVEMFWSEVMFGVQAGTTYRIAVAGSNDEAGNADVTLTFTPSTELIPGDSNHDGRFDSRDLVVVFVAGKYEDGIPGNATFEEGDWNGDGDFNTSDLVFAFEAGTYQLAARYKHVAREVDYFSDLFNEDDRFDRAAKWKGALDEAIADEFAAAAVDV